jgi:hypothetical protein
VSVDQLLGQFMNLEDNIREGILLSRSHKNRLTQWQGRKIVGSRLGSLVSELGVGFLVIAPHSMRKGKVRKWAQETGQILAHCVKQDLPLMKCVRFLAHFCNIYVEHLLQDGQDDLKVEALDRILAAFTMCLGSQGILDVKQYAKQIMTLESLPQGTKEDTDEDMGLETMDLVSIRNHGWLTVRAMSTLIQVHYRDCVQSCEKSGNGARWSLSPLLLHHRASILSAEPWSGFDAAQRILVPVYYQRGYHTHDIPSFDQTLLGRP